MSFSSFISYISDFCRKPPAVGEENKSQASYKPVRTVEQGPGLQIDFSPVPAQDSSSHSSLGPDTPKSPKPKLLKRRINSLYSETEEGKTSQSSAVSKRIEHIRTLSSLPVESNTFNPFPCTFSVITKGYPHDWSNRVRSGSYVPPGRRPNPMCTCCSVIPDKEAEKSKTLSNSGSSVTSSLSAIGEETENSPLSNSGSSKSSDFSVVGKEWVKTITLENANDDD